MAGWSGAGPWKRPSIWTTAARIEGAARFISTGCLKDAPFKTIALTNRFIDSGTVYADASAVDNYVGAMQSITKTIFANFEKTYLDCP